MDTLDGRAARLTNIQSLFDVKYDMMANILSFGVTPASMIYFRRLNTYINSTGQLHLSILLQLH